MRTSRRTCAGKAAGSRRCVGRCRPGTAVRGWWLSGQPALQLCHRHDPVSAHHPAGRAQADLCRSFPEAPPPDGQPRPRPPIDFVGNAVLAAYSLPKYETIRDDIRSILQGNRRLERLRALQDRTRKDRARIPFKHGRQAPEFDRTRPGGADGSAQSRGRLSRMLSDVSTPAGSYSTTDTLAAIVAHGRGRSAIGRRHLSARGAADLARRKFRHLFR